MILTELRPGEKLPNEAELSSRFSASRSSVREALQAIEALHIVEKRNGGTFVTSDMQECFVDPLRVMVQLNFVKKKELLEIRKMLETEAAGSCATRATEEHVLKLENITWLMQKPNIGIEEYLDLDVQFHLAIAEASGNSVLCQLMKDVSTVVFKFFPRVCTLEIAKESAIPLKLSLTQAIKNRNIEQARTIMAKHMDEFIMLMETDII